MCKKTFFVDGKVLFKEGDTYHARKATDQYGDYFVVYGNHIIFTLEPDYEIFNATYDKIPNHNNFCISEYFYTKAEWREKQINNILE